MVFVRGNRLGNTRGKVWVGARVSQPNWVATVATQGLSVLERTAAAAAHGVKGPPVPAREAASGANCFVETRRQSKGILLTAIALCVHHPRLLN